MPLLRLPNELILLIAENIEYPAYLNALCKSNRHLASLLTPLLHSFAAQEDYSVVALHWAAAIGDETLVRYIMENGAGFWVKDDIPVGALGHFDLCRCGPCNDEVVQFLMERGACLAIHEAGDDSPMQSSLHLVVQRGQMTVLKFLLENGANTELMDNDRATPLHRACSSEVGTKLLLQHGADIEAHCYQWRTPLYHAILGGDETVVRLLLEKDADVQEEDHLSQSPLHIAVKIAATGSKEDTTLAKLLLAHGADISVIDQFDETPIDLAYRLCPGVAMQLLDNADSSFGACGGKTALHLAAMEGYKSLCGRLLENGVDIDATDDDGQTALHIALMRGHNGVAKMLIMEGADLDITDPTDHYDALDLARMYGNEAMVKFILGFQASEDWSLDRIMEGHYRSRGKR